MKYVRLNNDSLMPIIGLGTWKSSTGEVYQAIRWAIKLGYRQIDCAPIYGNEKEVGQAIHDAIKEGDIKRNDLFVTSKLWNNAHAKEAVIPALKQTLVDLQLEYLDLYLMHWPVAQKEDVLMPSKAEDMISLKKIPLEVTWAGMEDAYNQGLVKSIGVSNFNAKKLENLKQKAEVMPSVNQIEHHPLLQQNDLIDYCKKNMITITAYSPLGSMDRDASLKHANEPVLLENAVIKEISERLKVSPAQILLAWSMNKDIVVIPKSVHQNHINENFAAQAVELDDADMKKIDALDKNYRYLQGEVFVLGDYTLENIWEE